MQQSGKKLRVWFICQNNTCIQCGTILEQHFSKKLPSSCPILKKSSAMLQLAWIWKLGMTLSVIGTTTGNKKAVAKTTTCFVYTFKKSR